MTTRRRHVRRRRLRCGGGSATTLVLVVRRDHRHGRRRRTSVMSLPGSEPCGRIRKGSTMSGTSNLGEWMDSTVSCSVLRLLVRRPACVAQAPAPKPGSERSTWTPEIATEATQHSPSGMWRSRIDAASFKPAGPF